jgi:hypothetical protein
VPVMRTWSLKHLEVSDYLDADKEVLLMLVRRLVSTSQASSHICDAGCQCQYIVQL